MYYKEHEKLIDAKYILLMFKLGGIKSNHPLWPFRHITYLYINTLFGIDKFWILSKGIHLICRITTESFLFFSFFLLALLPNAFSFMRFLHHPTTHHSRQDSSGWVISLMQRYLPDKTRHSKETDIHDPGGIRAHNLNKRAAPDLRLRPRGHWNRQRKLS